MWGGHLSFSLERGIWPQEPLGHLAIRVRVGHSMSWFHAAGERCEDLARYWRTLCLFCNRMAKKNWVGDSDGLFWSYLRPFTFACSGQGTCAHVQGLWFLRKIIRLHKDREWFTRDSIRTLPNIPTQSTAIHPRPLPPRKLLGCWKISLALLLATVQKQGVQKWRENDVVYLRSPSLQQWPSSNSQGNW